MTNGQMSINTEAVASAVNAVAIDVADIHTRLKRFLALLEEKNNQTKGKFAIVKTLSTKIETEVQNVQGLNDACDQIREALNRYIEIGEQANDDSAFRIDE